MAKYLLLRGWLVFLKTSVRCGLPIFLKVNHQLESRMQEICQSGSEGGAKLTFVPTPISAQALAWGAFFLRATPVRAPNNPGGNPYRPHPNSDDYLPRPYRAGRFYCNAT